MNDFNQSKEADSTVSIYGSSRPLLEQTMQMLLEEIAKIREEMTEELGMDPIEHLLGRIKSEESMREKCRRKGLPETQESALVKIHDAIGLRVVCAFIDDVYTIRDRLLALPRIRLVEEKDYIRHVKPNGYRSFHMIIIVDGQIYAEIQLRFYHTPFSAPRKRPISCIDSSNQYKIYNSRRKRRPSCPYIIIP